MALNKSKGNMYGFVTHTWNPLGGECSHKCSYCYVNDLKQKSEVIMNKYSGSPRIWETEMKTYLGNHNTIFVCDMMDLFADDVPEEDIIRILRKCNESDRSNQFLFQTKNPMRIVRDDYIRHNIRPGSIICTTIETNFGREDIRDAMQFLGDISTFLDIIITIEPIMKFDLSGLLQMITSIPNIVQINIGADSKNSGLEEPTSEEVYELIKALKTMGYKLYIKDNLKRLL